jgi:hypothetical protein
VEATVFMAKEADFDGYPIWILFAALSIPFSLFLAFSAMTILLFVAGIAIGFTLGFTAARREIHSIETKGEYKASPKTVGYIASAMIISLLIFVALRGMANPIFTGFGPAWAAIWIFRATFDLTFLRWEKKKEQIIMYDGFLGSRQYAVPKIAAPSSRDQTASAPG